MITASIDHYRFGKVKLPLQGPLYPILFTGDIAEVLNGSKNIGMRYYLDGFVRDEYKGSFGSIMSDDYMDDIKDWKAKIEFRLRGEENNWSHANTHFCLYRRPLRNWIKYLIFKITGNYKP